ncbi:hypothetical protein GGTG_14309 [Gaeumannomyces tritici R3-111a-1]|uniref:Uncharacterized protein n=1 Tax=Gaeumannomyces tritici (strain R3-111a-1) TaxID=644352 RepID=J3PL62_GAET3|nr:hypothetical protein GGTG_14309 [Gaeumannomyces tritici R3-111a-1]EJT68112.1 hypothetical protein GGTG_14309 [Gaeumannomyces tritici R3-111a-1]
MPLPPKPPFGYNCQDVDPLFNRRCAQTHKKDPNDSHGKESGPCEVYVGYGQVHRTNKARIQKAVLQPPAV